MTRPIPKLLGTFTILVALLLVTAFILHSMRPAPAPPPLPDPNGYDDFVAAGKMVSDDYSSYTEKSQQELKAFVSKNSEALKLARKGLTRGCRVPLVYSFTDPAFLQNLGKLKAVAFMFAAEGRLAE